jgi:hypothetical protein
LKPNNDEDVNDDTGVEEGREKGKTINPLHHAVMCSPRQQMAAFPFEWVHLL